MKTLKVIFVNYIFISLTPVTAHALSTPEEIRDSTTNSNAITNPKQYPTPKEKRFKLPPPRETPRPHNMEPPIAPIDPQNAKKIPPVDLPVPGEDPRTE